MAARSTTTQQGRSCQSATRACILLPAPSPPQEYILGQAQMILNSPMGPMLEPLILSMEGITGRATAHGFVPPGAGAAAGAAAGATPSEPSASAAAPAAAGPAVAAAADSLSSRGQPDAPAAAEQAAGGPADPGGADGGSPELTAGADLVVSAAQQQPPLDAL